MHTVVYIFVLLALAACGQTKQPAAPPVVVGPVDFPVVLVAAGPAGVQMQEFSTARACGEASAYIESGSNGRVVTKCIAR